MAEALLVPRARMPRQTKTYMLEDFMRDVRNLSDPHRFLANCWPGIRLYQKQWDIWQSVIENRDTLVVAANDTGKSFITALICIWFFVSRTPCRVITHSTNADQLDRVLWGEIRQLISTCCQPLPIKMYGDINHGIKQVLPGTGIDPRSEFVGRVSDSEAGLLGRHLPSFDVSDPTPRVLFVSDECSGIRQTAWDTVGTCAHRRLGIGNAYWPKWNTFFVNDTEAGDMKDPYGPGYLRKVFRISAWDSPKVKFGLRLNGKAWTAKDKREYDLLDRAIPGVLGWKEFQTRQLMWDDVKKEIGLHGRFPKDAATMMYPADWLDRAEAIAEGGKTDWGTFPKINWAQTAGECMGIDAAMGNDNTAWAVINQLGLLDLYGEKTPDTNVICGRTIQFGAKWRVPTERWLFDALGGGLQITQYMRKIEQGGKKPYAHVRTVNFSETASPPVHRHMTTMGEQTANREVLTAYKNRRAEMYWLLRLTLDPIMNPRGFALPSKLINAPRKDGGPSLRTQLSKVQIMYDGEGRLQIPPKHRSDGNKSMVAAREDCLYDLLGCSPDELDALVLAVFGFKAPLKPRVQAMG